MIVMPMRFEDVFRDNIGAIFMIDKFLRDNLLKIDKNSICEYVIYNDEMTFMIDDIIEMECYWYDIDQIFRYCGKNLFFTGKVISKSIMENGCIAVIKNTSIVKKDFEVMINIDRENMLRVYMKLKDKMVNSFKSIWDFFNKLKIFYLKTIRFNRNILLFC